MLIYLKVAADVKLCLPLPAFLADESGNARVRFSAVGRFQPRGHRTLARLKETRQLRQFLWLN